MQVERTETRSKELWLWEGKFWARIGASQDVFVGGGWATSLGGRWPVLEARAELCVQVFLFYPVNNGEFSGREVAPIFSFCAASLKRASSDLVTRFHLDGNCQVGRAAGRASWTREGRLGTEDQTLGVLTREAFVLRPHRL